MVLSPQDEEVPARRSRRALLEKASMLGGLGLASAAGLLPGVAQACHTIPKSQGGCMKASSSSSGSSSSGSSGSSSGSSGSSASSSPPTTSSGGKSSWTGIVSSGDYGADPYKYFSTSNKAWAVSKHLAVAKNAPRVTLGAAPDGRPSVQMNIPSGMNFDNNFLTAPFGSRGVDKAIASLEMYLPSDFDWNTSTGKLAFGVWGGEGDVSGGVPVSQQKGFSVRNVRANDKSALWGARIYSYHLNRTSGNFGQTSSQSTPHLPRGRWVKFELEVGLNTVGANNGYATLRMDGVQYVQMTGLNFRKTNDIGIRGMFWQDMWGGTEEDKVNWSPRAQKMWYSNYKLQQI